MPELQDNGVSEDRLLGGKLVLFQRRRGHRAGTDAVLLAMLTEARPGDGIVDLGAGTGAVGLALALRQADATVTLIENDSELVALCHRNIAANGLEARVRAAAADVYSSDLAGNGIRGSTDLVVTNPPFFEEGERPSPTGERARAHVMGPQGLGGWLEAAGRLLSAGGRLSFIHRADALARAMAALPAGFGAVSLTPVYPREGASASRMVVAAVKGRHGPSTIREPLVLHDEAGGFTPRASALHRGEGA